MVDAAVEFGGYDPRRRERHLRLRKLVHDTPSRKRMVNRKLRDVRRKLENLRTYADRLDPMLGCKKYVVAAKDCLNRLPQKVDDSSFPNFQSLIEDPFFYTAPMNPTNCCMVRLYWFFRRGCRLSGDESEVRVALIRNAFWGKYGIAPVSYRPDYSEAESKGCPAVHEAVRRFRL